GPGPGAGRALPGGPAAGDAAEPGGAHRDPGDAGLGRRAAGGVPHPRGRLHRPGPPAAGVVPGRRAGRAAGLPDRGVGDRAATGPGRHRRGRARVHPGQPGRRVVRRGVGGPAVGRRPAPGHRRRRGRRAGPGHGRHRARADGRAGPGRGDRHLLAAGRAALRPPGGGLQPARLPYRAGRARRQLVHRRGAGRRRAGLRGGAGGPAARHRRGPGLGAGGLADAIDAVAGDLADAVIEVPAGAPGDPEAGPDVAGGPATALAPRTVAILNRGTPSGLVTPDGAATMALMRACSTWPCGVWIDGPARTAPDGTSFAWQHWSHTFEYALAAGPGDWRQPGLAQQGLDYNAPLLAVTTGPHAGPLPATASLASVEPPAAILSALKPRGNPLAPEAGGGAPPSPAGGVTVRLREAGQGPVTAQVRLFTGLTAARGLSL